MSQHYNFDESILKELFENAKKKDEFEFCCSLLRITGLKGPGWDSLEESSRLISEVLNLVKSIKSDMFRIRMYLLLYCHIIEMDDLYSIVANLLWILLGERYHVDPFLYRLYPDGQAANNNQKKLERIKELSSKANNPLVGELFDFLLVKQVRNAFFHSDYTLYKDEFRIINGEGVEVNGVITRAIPFDWLFPRIEAAINVILQLISLLMEYRRSYKEGKVVKGRMGSNSEYVDIVLVVDKEGLIGMRSE
jgi:hypothetical protein